MRSRLILVPLALLVVAAGPFGRKKPPEPEPEPVAAPAPRAPAPIRGLFADPLPIDVGGVPEGLANLSAQGCNGCHFEAHDGWAGSAHATGWSAPTFVEAVAEANTPACTACHLPLATQQPGTAAYDPTLHTEGVTCAACHVRDGKVVAAAPVGAAPHPMAHSPELSGSALCASCHQLTWPGADKPLYDTYGEWQASPHAKAGIDCQDCHMASGADARLGTDHGSASDPARAVSLLVHVDRITLVRGGPPIEVGLIAQNTGAGHAFPTGSPWRGVQLRAALVGPVGRDGELGPHPDATFTADLRRRVADEPPWRTLEDTRLPAGGQKSWQASLALPHDAIAGAWMLEVALVETLDGSPRGEPFSVQRVPLQVD